MCNECVNIDSPSEVIDVRWSRTSNSCPDEKKEWFNTVAELNGIECGLFPSRVRKETEEKLIKNADEARLAMLAAYGMADLYFEPLS